MKKSIITLIIVILGIINVPGKVSAAVTKDLTSTNMLWEGSLVSPGGENLHLFLKYIDDNLYVIINNNTFLAHDYREYTDNTISFYIMPSDNEREKLKFAGEIIDNKIISGKVIDISGNTGTWNVNNQTKTLSDNWIGKLTAPNGERLDLNIVKVYNDVEIFVYIADKKYKAQDVTFLPNDSVRFYIIISDYQSSRLDFEGKIIDGWIIAGKVFDVQNKEGSWLVKKDLDEYGFISAPGDKLITGAQVVDIKSEDERTDNKVLFKLKSFDIDESAIIPQKTLNEIIRPYYGKIVSPDDIRVVVDKINQIYVDKGFITAKAFLAPQTIEDGKVKITLVEGHIGAISFEGNTFTRDCYITGKLSQQPGDLFDLAQLEQDLNKFNLRNSVKLKASLKPGAELGATDIVIKATDQNPYHLRPTFDNTGRESFGVLRAGVAFSSESLLGIRDQFVAGYSRAKAANIAYSSYNIPIGDYGTRIGGQFAYSGIGIRKGPFGGIGLEGDAYSYGGYIIQPILTRRNMDLSFDLGFNFKDSSTSLNGTQFFRTQVRDLVAGLNYEFRDKYGKWYTRNAFATGLDVWGGDESYFKYNGTFARIHNFGHRILGIFRASTQITAQNLVPMEQYQLGGSNTVRGYSEGLLLGDNAYFISAEFRLPLPFLPENIGALKVRDRISGVVFVDHGGAFMSGGRPGAKPSDNYLTSVGCGLRAAITKYLAGRLDWGFPLDKREADQPTARLHFGLEAYPF